MGRILVLGTSHAVAPAELRDGLHLDGDASTEFLAALGSGESIVEATLLSTCTRFEVYVVCEDPDAAETEILDVLGRHGPARPGGIADHSYAFTDDDAVRHLLRVAAGLDSIVLGEPQILGQVREAAALAREAGASGPILRRLFASAVRAGKRTRAETGLGRGPASLAAAGVRLALRAADDVSTLRVLVLGAGETASLAARHVAKRGPSRLVILNRSAEPARRLADELRCEAGTLDALAAHLRDATVVIAATAAADPVVGSELLAELMGSRDEPLLLVDLGRPRNVEAPDEPIPGLAILDLDGLAETVERNRRAQTREIPRAESIVGEELDRFRVWRRGRDVLPHVRALRRRFFETGRRVARSQAASFDDHAALEAYTRGLIAKLLHEPTVRIKRTDRESAEGAARLDALAALFDLDV